MSNFWPDTQLSPHFFFRTDYYAPNFPPKSATWLEHNLNTPKLVVPHEIRADLGLSPVVVPRRAFIQVFPRSFSQAFPPLFQLRPPPSEEITHHTLFVCSVRECEKSCAHSSGGANKRLHVESGWKNNNKNKKKSGSTGHVGGWVGGESKDQLSRTLCAIGASQLAISSKVGVGRMSFSGSTC